MRRRVLTLAGLAGFLSPLAAAGQAAWAASPCGANGVYSTSGATATCTYGQAGTDSFTVPAGISSLDVVAVGAAGGTGFDSLAAIGPARSVPGGRGASVEDTSVPTSGGQTLSVVVGGAGKAGTGFSGGGAGGSPGGGGAAGDAGVSRGTQDGGGGGGYSGVLDPSNNPLVIAGGGGGGGGGAASGGNGGDGDTGSGGGNGQTGVLSGNNYGGGGGGAHGTTGGAAGTAGGNCSSLPGGDPGSGGTPGAGTQGSALSGGPGGTSGGFDNSSGGGGGGGYAGGGGGGGGCSGGGGGGGSSFGTTGLANETTSSAGASVTISWTRQANPITFPATAVTYGQPDFSPASAPGGPVVYSNPNGSCQVVNGGSQLHITGAGSCTATANQPGNSSYAAAAPVTQTFAINRAAQTVSFSTSPPQDLVAGESYSVGASSSVGLPVSLSIDSTSTPAGCTISGSTVSTHRGGTCVLDARQAGDANHLPAQAQQRVSIQPDLDRIAHLRVHRSGVVTFQVRVNAPGVVNAMLTAWSDNIASTARLLEPAAGRFVYARASATAQQSGVLTLRVTPNARGRFLLRHPSYHPTLRLWVSYIPAGGFQNDIGYYGLHLGTRCGACHMRRWP